MKIPGNHTLPLSIWIGMSEKWFDDKNFRKFLGIVGIKWSLHVADVEARPELAAPQKKV